MHKAIIQALKASTAHGLSHAVGTKSLGLRIMYITAFIIFCSLFVYNSLDLLQKLLQSQKISRDYEYNEDDFEFPDLYFCPLNPYSGSFPFVLREEEADEVNKELRRAGDAFDNYFEKLTFFKKPDFKHVVVQNSISYRLIAKYLSHRLSQSTFINRIHLAYESWKVPIYVFHHPMSIVCFRTDLYENYRELLKVPGHTLSFWMMTDPHGADFNFSGSPIDPISIKGKKYARNFEDWKSTGQTILKENGFHLLIVPRGTYPSLTRETNVALGPGNSYKIKLHMEKFDFSRSLYGSHCRSDDPEVIVTDPVTGGQQKFNYSYAACYYEAKNRLSGERFGCIPSGQPKLWQHRNLPYCLNVSEASQPTVKNFLDYYRYLTQVEEDAVAACKRQYPRQYVSFKPEVSSAKWPGSDGELVNFWAKFGLRYFDLSKMDRTMPAIMKVIELARKLYNGSHSPHDEAQFYKYISNSMLQVVVSAGDLKSTKVHLLPAYSLTQFLADAGGLLGLYIGCSLLTVLEIVEFVHNLVLIKFSSERPQEEEVEETGDVEDKIEN